MGIEVKTLNRLVSNKPTMQKDLKNEKKSFWANPEILEGADAVIHLAGANVAEPWTKAHKNRILQSRIDGTEALVNAIAACIHPPKKLISTSAIGYYPDPCFEILTEESHGSNSFLSNVCQQWEKALYCAPLPLTDISVVRVGLVLATDSKIITASAMSYLLSGTVSIVGSKKNMWSWIHIHDLSNLFISLANGDINFGIYNGVAPVPLEQGNFGLTFERFPVIGQTIPKPVRRLKNIARKINKIWFGFRIIVPSWGIRLLWGERAQIALTNQNVSAQKTIHSGFVFQYPTIELALEALSKNNPND